MTRLLVRLFPRPLSPKREKPEEIIYGIDERPPASILLSVGAQHALLALMFGIYAVIAGQAVGLDNSEIVRFASSCFFLLGLGTILQALRSRFTPGILLVTIPNPITLGAYTAVIIQYGLGAATGAIVVSNIAIIVLARFLPRMRSVFPPEVIGVVVLMLGVSMVTGGMGRSVGLMPGNEMSAGAALTAFVTIACIVAFSVWGSRQLRTMAVLIGMAAGVIAAFATGATDLATFSEIAGLPVFALPFISGPLALPELVPAAIVTIFLVELLSSMDQFACALTIDKLNDAKWRRADMSMVSRSVSATAFANILSGLAGSLTGGSSSANIGLAHSTGVMSRYLGFVAGILLCATAFFPTVPGLIVLTPAPVIGGILVYTASFMIVAGMDLILSRMLNTQRTFTVGLSVVLGTAVMLLPEMVNEAPGWSRTIVESGLTVGSLAAILLNALFRIGVTRSDRIMLTQPNPSEAAAAFLEHNGKIWGARKDVVMRAAIAVGEALEAIEDADLMKGPATLSASFDEFNLVCQLSYAGKALVLTQHQQLDAKTILDEDDDAMLDMAMMRVSSTLVSRLADRVRSNEQHGRAMLHLHFEH